MGKLLVQHNAQALQVCVRVKHQLVSEVIFPQLTLWRENLVCARLACLEKVLPHARIR